jgi:hypothetical protein
MITNFCVLYQFSAEKNLRFSQKPMLWSIFLKILAVVWAKTPFFAKFFDENIFKIITSVPDWADFCSWSWVIFHMKHLVTLVMNVNFSIFVIEIRVFTRKTPNATILKWHSMAGWPDEFMKKHPKSRKIIIVQIYTLLFRGKKLTKI